MGKKTESKEKETKGCVGYVKEGIMKNARMIVVYSASNDPKDIYDEYSEIYGQDIKIRYCLCSNAKSAHNKFKEKLEPNHHLGNIYCSTSLSVDGRLREATEEKTVHNYPKASKKKKDESDDDKPKKSKPKPKGKSKKTKNADTESDNESDDESSDSEPEEETKPKSKKIADKFSRRK